MFWWEIRDKNGIWEYACFASGRSILMDKSLTMQHSHKCNVERMLGLKEHSEPEELDEETLAFLQRAAMKGAFLISRNEFPVGSGKVTMSSYPRDGVAMLSLAQRGNECYKTIIERLFALHVLCRERLVGCLGSVLCGKMISLEVKKMFDAQFDF